MPKEKLTVYVERETLRALEDLAGKRGKSKSLIAEAAITSFLTPDAAERQEAAIARRLDQQNRTAERLERNLGIAIEMLALFLRHWLTTTPAIPETAQAAAQAKGKARYEAFVTALGRRLARGASFAREVSFDLPATEADDG
jgi:predicted transcriptional regulator